MNEPFTTSMAPRCRSNRCPADRTYAIIHWTMMGLIAVIVLSIYVVPRYIPIARLVGFRSVVTAMLCMNVLWWSVADRRFARYVQSPRVSMMLRVFTLLITLSLNAPIVCLLITGRLPVFMTTSPSWYSAAVTLWQIGLVAAMPIIAALRLIMLGAWSVAKRLVRRRGDSQTIATIGEPDLTRRAWLKTAFGSVPIAMLVGGTAASQRQMGHFGVNRRKLAAPWLPDRLRGLTITHISDLHVGRLYRPYMLPRLVDAVNRLDSDILIITGDIVDITNDMLPPALEAISQMRHRYGAYACIGNHDEIDDREEFVRQCRRRLPLLIDEWRVVEIDGERLTIGGVDWARLDHGVGQHQGLSEHVTAALSGYDAQRDGPMIALAHHPHAWDFLASQGVPLVLSGHTHGGQIMFTPPDSRPDVGAGAALFRYIRGIYEQPGSTLFVNRGVGNWFPLRINSPAEIVQLQLV